MGEEEDVIILSVTPPFNDSKFVDEGSSARDTSVEVRTAFGSGPGGCRPAPVQYSTRQRLATLSCRTPPLPA